MPEDIRGLRIVFDADTSTFKKQLKEMDSDLKTTQKQLKATQQALELEYDAEKFSEAQQLAQKAIKDTEERAVILRKRLDHIQQAGITEKNQKEFRNLQTELLHTENRAKRLESQLDDINKIKFNHISANVDKIGQGFQKAGQVLVPISAAAGAALVGLGAGVNSAIEKGDALATTAGKLGITAEKLQQLSYIAQQTDVDMNNLTKGFEKTRQALGEKLIGDTSNATKAFDALGLSVINLDGTTKSSEVMFNEVLMALGTIEDDTLQASYAVKIFGDDLANQLLPVLKVGADGLQSLNDEFESMPKLTDEQVVSLSELDGVLDSLKLQFAVIAQQIAIEFLPVVENIAKFMNEKVKPALEGFQDWLAGLSDGQKTAIVAILGIVSALAPLLLITGKATSGISNMIGMIGSLAPAIQGLLGPVGIILGILALLYSTNEDFRKSINNLMSTLMTALKPILDLVLVIFNELMASIVPLISLLGLLLAPAIDLISFNLSMMLDTLTPILESIVNLITWFSGLSKVIYEFLYDVLEPLIGGFQKVWTWLSKILGLDGSKLEIETQVSTNKAPNVTSPSINPIADQFAQQNAMKDIITGNNKAISNITNNNDYSQKSIEVNLTIQNYGAELDYDEVMEKLNFEFAKQF